MMIRTYLRRSKNDEGKQQFSLDVQREGCQTFVRQRFELADLQHTEYLDDGKAGDDFHSRVGMRRLILEALPGDIIICRDQSRLGRDAIEVTLAIRDLVRDRGCRLYYYVTGQEVQFANAIDQATTFIQGTGHQMELEAIRSRTREALRSRVREGRIAGGRCYGYDLVRKSDATGRGYTLAVVNAKQAEVVRRIYAEYLAGAGLKAIAKALNREGVPSPTAGRRGSRSWSPGGIRPMLQNARYRGVYMHGRIKKVRRGGRTMSVKADPSEVISVDVPEWRIVDDETWFAVQEIFRPRAAAADGPPRVARPVAKYPLAGIATCGMCGGSIGAAFTKRRGERVKAYACRRHHQCGGKACSVTVHQPMDEVEQALIDHLEREVLTADCAPELVARIQRAAKARLPTPDEDLGALEADLAQARSEQGRIARAIALTDDVAELVTELNQRRSRIRYLEGQLEAAQREPNELAELLEQVEARARAKVAELRTALRESEDLRTVFASLFRDGLRFTPEWVETEAGRRHIWRITGPAHVDPGPLPVATPQPSAGVVSRPEATDFTGSLGGGPLCKATPTGFEFIICLRKVQTISRTSMDLRHLRIEPVPSCPTQ